MAGPFCEVSYVRITFRARFGADAAFRGRKSAIFLGYFDPQDL